MLPHPLATILRDSPDGSLADLARQLSDEELAGLMRLQSDAELVRVVLTVQTGPEPPSAKPAPVEPEDEGELVGDGDVLEAVGGLTRKRVPVTLRALREACAIDYGSAAGLPQALRRLVHRDALRLTGRGKGAVYSMPVATEEAPDATP